MLSATALKERRKVFRRGGNLKTRGVADKKLRTRLGRVNQKASNAAQHAAKADMLLPSTLGVLEADGEMEETWRFKQSAIQEAVDLQSAHKVFQLSLSAGPYVPAFSPNGKFLLLAGQRGHLATTVLQTHKLQFETQLRDTVHDATFLHNNTLVAVAQGRYAYMYDGETGAEVHCMRNHLRPLRLQFLRYHFLLASINTGGALRYQDTSTGSTVAEIRTGMGACHCMEQSPYNAVIHLGHPNGTVTLWSPSTAKPLAKMLCHNGAVLSLAMDHGGQYMVTAGLDAKVCVWDVRKFQKVHEYVSPVQCPTMAVSDRGILALGYGRHVQLWKDALATKQQRPYLNHDLQGPVHRLAFVPFEDVLGIGHTDGFETILVPGSGEPNFDSREANPFETSKQRSEREVQSLLEKLPPETIALEPNKIGALNPGVNAEQVKKAELARQANNKPPPKDKHKTKGRSSATKRLRRKKATNVVDRRSAQLARAREAREAREAKQKQAKQKANADRSGLDRALSRFE